MGGERCDLITLILSKNDIDIDTDAVIIKLN